MVRACQRALRQLRGRLDAQRRGAAAAGQQLASCNARGAPAQACSFLWTPALCSAQQAFRHRRSECLRSACDGVQAHISMGDIDLLHPPRELEQRRHKLKRLVQSPNSFFMDVKCPGCFNMCAPRTLRLLQLCASSRVRPLTQPPLPPFPRSTTVFSHAQTVVICSGCSTVLCQPTGGKSRLTEGCSFRKKTD
jgi:small subunit ribosomal protein S27e